jgi:quercetin dioxygenase-like cupin family protein
MAERKYEKYIIKDLKLPADVAARQEVYNQRATRILWLEDEIVKGASSVILSWYWKPTEQEGTPSHVHDFDEIIGFVGGDPQNPRKLYGEVEMWLDDEKYMLTESCLVFIPAGLRHCPLRVTKVERPLLFLAFSLTTKYVKDGVVRATA